MDYLSSFTPYLPKTPFPSVESRFISVMLCFSDHPDHRHQISWNQIPLEEMEKMKKETYWKKKNINIDTSRWEANKDNIRKVLWDLRWKEDAKFRKTLESKIVIQGLHPELIRFVKKEINDLDILDYKIGQPISPIEAKKNFILPTIDLQKVPRNQKSLITDGHLLDVITFETIPLKDCVQLKKDGYIVSIETFHDLIKNNTTTWQGKTNVGFKSPETETIYGNLVLFQYDDEYYPQKPGILRIERIPNIHNTLYKKKEPIPKYWWKCCYMDTRGKSYNLKLNLQPVCFFVPDNEDGKIILMMYLESFKKGNLFGFTPSGLVRLGRIHLKINTESSSHGFPDETFDQRILGELSKNGATSDTAQFNANGGKWSQNDPYPKEKRWQIQWK